MAIQPFKMPKNLEEDFDAAQDKLSKWLDKVTPLFLESPEYAKLSKANKKNEGDWFQLFMELNLGYLGVSLADMTLSDAEEIVIDLIPRKMICSDTQAKTIVPELIAYWEFLARETQANKSKPVLENAVDIIGFLKGVKRDYLKIYNREPELISEEVSENNSLQMRDRFWSDLIKVCAACMESQPSAVDDQEKWAVLYDEDYFEDFLRYICLVGFDTNNENTIHAVIHLLGLALNQLFIRVRQGDKIAEECWFACEENIMGASESNALKPEAVKALMLCLGDMREHLSSKFVESFQQHLMADHNDMPDAPISFDQVKHAILSELGGINDEFDVVESLQQLFGFLPEEAFEVVTATLYASDNPVMWDSLSLLLLDRDQARATKVAQLLVQHPKVVGQSALGRLVRVRNWLPASIQKPADQLIKKVRKRGVMPAQMPSVSEENFVGIYMSGVDGSGAQGVLAVVKFEDGCRALGFVLKEGVGVVDCWVSELESRADSMHYVNQCKSQVGGLEKVSLELVQKILPIFISLNLKSRTPFDYGLVHILELMGMEDWNPDVTAIEQLLSSSNQAVPTSAEIQQAQKRSAKWADSSVGESWFIGDQQQVSDICSQFGQSRKVLIQSLCEHALEPVRKQWQERMARMALWAEYGPSRRQRQARDFAVVGWLLAQDIPAYDIELLRGVAKSTTYRI